MPNLRNKREESSRKGSSLMEEMTIDQPSRLLSAPSCL